MRIDSSTVQMASHRYYSAEAGETQSTVSRTYNGDVLEKAVVNREKVKISQFEVEGGTSVYMTSSAGVTRRDDGNADYKSEESRPLNSGDTGRGAAVQFVSVPGSSNWFGNYLRLNPENQFLKMLLEMLERFTGKKGSQSSWNMPAMNAGTASRYYQMSASLAFAQYQKTAAVFRGQSGAEEADLAKGGQGSSVNGRWTRQTIRSGFVSGQENTAFSSAGTVLTSDGRTIDFNITLEMSRSFAAAYVITGAEEVYTDPLVINMDTDAAELSDVSFYFDLNCDGTAEEISGLSSSSGFLALDRNGDGEINDGSELFGARTGDGFGELARYDQDGNGWIDEGDEIFSQLSVWVKCGTEGARLLTLAEADVGAIFLGSQSTNYSLADPGKAGGAKIRRTGIYLKENGQAGTVQHVDFKA